MSVTNEIAFDDATRVPPPADFAARAVANDPAIWDKAAADPEAWWASWADKLDWIEPYQNVLTWNLPDARWFEGGKLNACANVLDRWAAQKPDEVAMIGEGEPGDVTTYTWREARDECARIANLLKELGVRKGDRVALSMPMVPELGLAMLACARIGAVHTVVFGGFSADALAERTHDSGAKLIITADYGYRRTKHVGLLDITLEALSENCPTVEHVLVWSREGAKIEIPNYPHPDGSGEVEFIDWRARVPQMSADCPPEPMDSEDYLFILYTSGSTGKPKGIVHSTAGYMTGVTATSKLTFDLRDGDLLFCTADLGWVTGHSYIVYGPMANGCPVLLYEGAPDTPNRDRFWRMIEKHRPTILYTAPTAIRSFMKWGRSLVDACDLSSLRLLGSVGEPINPAAWTWYHDVVGGGRCPVVDTWWQTETGAHMITPLPGLSTLKPGSATRPFPGISIKVVDEDGKDICDQGGPAKGLLAIDKPWPSMLRGIWGARDRYVKTYWERIPGMYFAGDGVARDADGDHWLLGRVDDIMLVAGHNVSTMEIESALVSHEAVAEAAVIGKAHEIKGQAIAAFVIVREGHHTSVDDLKHHVTHKLGPVCRPDDVYLVPEVPKTRSGKIMRRLLRDIAEGRALGDTTTLADPGVMANLKDKYESAEG